MKNKIKNKKAKAVEAVEPAEAAEATQPAEVTELVEPAEVTELVEPDEVTDSNSKGKINVVVRVSTLFWNGKIQPHGAKLKVTKKELTQISGQVNRADGKPQ